LEPMGDSLPDWEIILRLASRMDSSMPYSLPQEVMNEIVESVPLYRGVDYAKLDMKAHRLGREQAGSRQMKFHAVKYVPQSSPEDGYPLTLLAGTTLYQFGTGSRSLRALRLKKFLPEAFVALSESDAKESEVKDGDRVKIVSPVGEVTTVARIGDTLSKGVICMPVSFPDSQVNGLFGVVLDPRAKTPALKTCRVRLERMGNDG